MRHIIVFKFTVNISGTSADNFRVHVPVFFPIGPSRCIDLNAMNNVLVIENKGGAMCTILDHGNRHSSASLVA